MKLIPFEVVALSDIKSIASQGFDSIVVVANSPENAPAFGDSLKHIVENDEAAKGPVANLYVLKEIPTGRLIFSCTGPIHRDFDDVRRFAEAGMKGIDRVVAAGHSKPLFVVQDYHRFSNSVLVTLLGAMQAAYTPLQSIEAGAKPKILKLGLFTKDGSNLQNIIDQAKAIESGRAVARDICGGDQEFMAPPKAADYIKAVFNGVENVKVQIINDQTLIEREYPCVAAVNRAVNKIPKYEARVVKLTFEGQGPISDTLMFVGKGVTFDTGGTDLKVSGAMLGMHHDKGGAAAVAGFFMTLAHLKPKGLKVVGTMPFVRNGIGPEAYACDEVIKNRFGKRIRIINTDAEGRMIMVDPLAELVEQAVKEINPHIFTIATLTGHAVLAMGEGYSVAIDNGPARALGDATKLQSVGEDYGDMFEVSVSRREDFDKHEPENIFQDMIQASTGPSTRTPRGHQIPFAFLQRGSGLEQHGNDSKQPLRYTHLDIAGSEKLQGSQEFGMPTGSPIVALTAAYVLPKLH